MAANDVTTLPQVTDTAAEKFEFGKPDWTAVHTVDAACDAVVAGVAGVQHFCQHVTLSYDEAPAKSTLTVEDGSDVIWISLIPAAAGPFDFDFSGSPLRGSPGNALHAKVTDPGGSVVACVSMIGYSSRNLTAFT
jgi:hypothetical protein